MKKNIWLVTIVTAILLLAFGSPALADGKSGARTYYVTITNLTGGQVFSPPIIYTHNGRVDLFSPAEEAPPELVPLAEDGDTGPLAAALGDDPAVFDVFPSEGVVPPGHSVTLQITAKGRFRYLSAAAMLVSSNDAFFTVENVRVTRWGSRSRTGVAYDAGSEYNSEECKFIPGPPCGSPGVRDEDREAEGFVFVHSGIHGIADLDPANADWRNPVVRVTVEPAGH
ncbi:hypothetical protein D3OALGA1CA_1683 [Olavius algarvensis associated proteobacterium Delta 3]|nr:hypothetical protein D3OALGA1CA_1683 [Olavius algarvensis associated proteobacterium Delta 3]